MLCDCVLHGYYFISIETVNAAVSRGKAAFIKKNFVTTGGGIGSDTEVEPLSIDEEKILALMGGEVVVGGDEDVIESGFPKAMPAVNMLQYFSLYLQFLL